MATKRDKYYFKDSLRDYQKELLQLLLAAALNGSDGSYSAEHLRVSPLVYLPTGAGKTRLASALMMSWLYHFPSSRCAFLVNRRTLLRQGHESIAAAAERWCDSRPHAEAAATPPRVGIIGGSSDCLPDAPLMVCSVQALLAARRKAAAAADASEAAAECEGHHHRPRSASSLSDASDGAGVGEDDIPAAAAPPSEGTIDTPPQAPLQQHDRPPPAASADGAPAGIPPFQLVIVDEAHAAYAAQYRGLLRDMRSRGAFVVGLTATPLRSNPSERLGTVFSHLLMGPGVNTLASSGVLVPPRHVAVHQDALMRDLGALACTSTGASSCRATSTRGGDGLPRAASWAPELDYCTSRLSRLMCSTEYLRAAVRAWKAHCRGRKGVAFAVDIAHSQALATAFTKAGVPAAHLDGSASKAERRRALLALREGDIALLCSVSLLSEGFDEPSVDAVLLARPTLSKALFLQQAGRGLRACAAMGKRDCVVLDMACNTLQHGCVVGPPWYAPEAGMWRSFVAAPQLRACAKLTAAVDAANFKPLLRQLRRRQRDLADMPGVITVPSARMGSAAGARPEGAPAVGVALCSDAQCATMQHAAQSTCHACGGATAPLQWSREGGLSAARPATAPAPAPRTAPHKAATAAAIAAVPLKAPAPRTAPHKAATAAAIVAVPLKAPAPRSAPHKAATAAMKPLAKRHVNTIAADKLRPKRRQHRGGGSRGGAPARSKQAEMADDMPDSSSSAAPKEATTLG